MKIYIKCNNFSLSIEPDNGNAIMSKFIEGEHDELKDDFAETLGQLLSYTVNEPITLRRLENFFKPHPAKLAKNKTQEESLRTTLSMLSEKLGGPPYGYTVLNDLSDSFKFDTYIPMAIDEVLSAFHRCRRVVCLSHMFFIAGKYLEETPTHVIPPIEPKHLTVLFERFWEQAEMAFIKIASFWDRIGQLLDFIFFNIRQYEHDGFPAVMDRIRVNFIPICKNLESNINWIKIRKYQNSEKKDGFKWLLRRRNLLIHSLHLSPISKSLGNYLIFNSIHNHLERKISNKLDAGSMEEELECAHLHLQTAADLFPAVIDLCILGADHKISGKM